MTVIVCFVATVAVRATMVSGVLTVAAVIVDPPEPKTIAT